MRVPARSACSERLVERRMLEKNRVLAIVVTYQPDESFAARFVHLAGQVGGVLIVDNNSGGEAVSMLYQTADRLNMQLVRNSENLGLASALNVGIRHAIASGYDWALLFDQDSAPGDQVFEGLRDAYEQFPSRKRLAVIGSNYRMRNTGKLQFPESATTNCVWSERRAVITSGSLVSLSAYRTLGPFRDEYFIDCVDHEYCLRARSKGFEIIATRKPLMVHGIGRPTVHRLPWRTIEVSNHAKIRRYYMIRNHIDMAKKYVLREPAWVLGSLWTRFKSILLLCLFETDRLAKIKYSMLGLIDGFYSKFDRKLVSEANRVLSRQ